MTTAIINAENLAKVPVPALLVGLVASALCIVSTVFDLEQVLRSYLLAHLFWWGIAIGCLGLWGFRRRRTQIDS